MGVWNHHVFSAAYGPGAANRRRERPTREALPGPAWSRLEIGFGTGLNLRHYPAAVAEILVVEPAASAMRLAEPRKAAVSANSTHVGLDGAQLHLPDGSVDCVLSSYTQCIIPDVAAALLEVHRVLKPEGALHFLEHGQAATESVRRWQHRLHPIHSRIAGGCHLDRPIDQLISNAGLIIRELETGYGQGPRPFSYLYLGRAELSRSGN